MTSVSIIVTAHNYAKYLRQCLDSALRQHYPNFEVVVVDDGSTDETPDILRGYASRVKVVRLEGVGLARACNAGIRAFDEHLLLVEAAVLDRDPNVHMVYPDYYRVNADGEVMEIVRLPRVYDEEQLLNVNPLAAGAMYRRECYEAVGGYNESLRQQEDYDFWLRFTHRYRVHNVNLPLMYYRRHDISMSTNTAGKLDARRAVKRKFLEEQGGGPAWSTAGIVPAMARRLGGTKLALRELAGRPLLAYPIEALRRTAGVDRVLVSTEDPEIADLARTLGAEVPFLRPDHLARPGVSVEAVVQHLLQTLARDEDYRPDAVAVAHVHSPFLRAKHVAEALHSLAIYETDSVISVTQDLTFHWRRGRLGLDPVGYQKRLLRAEKDVIYKENAALYLVRAELALGQDLLGERVGHVEMLNQESVRVDSEHDFFVAEQMLASGKYPL
jgi:N-acylneuraminate cytidylyltransferase